MAGEPDARLRCYAAGLMAADGVCTALMAIESYDREVRHPENYQHQKALNGDLTVYDLAARRIDRAADRSGPCWDMELGWVRKWRAHRDALLSLPEDQVARAENQRILTGLALNMRDASTAVLYPYGGPGERCVNCNRPIPGVHAPKEHPEISGSMMCAECACKEGLPTAENLGIGGRRR